MKRFFASLLVVLLSLSDFVTPAFAASTKYKLDELGLEVSIPLKYDVITQDTSPYSPIFSNRGLSGTDLIEQFKTSGIYLNAIPNDGTNEEIVVTMTDGIWDNLSVFSNTTIKTLASALVNEYKDYGITVSEYDVYQHSQAKFIKIYFTDAANSVYGLQYYTTYGAKAMNFTMRSYSEALSQNQEDTIKSIVDSIVYNTAPISAPSVTETDAFVYTDTETNTKFTVPANWHKEELFKDREYIDVKFASGKEEGLLIMYGSTDLWRMLTPEEQKGCSRSDLDSSAFEVSDIAALCGVDENKITKKTYNGKDYFQATVQQSTDMYDTTFTLEMTCAIRIENGWGYYFQFSGTTDNEYFADFQELLNTVEYPYYEREISTTRLKIALTFAITIIVLCGLFYIFIDRRIHKSEQKGIRTETFNGTCPYCNAPQLDNGGFCHKCGKNLSTTSDKKNN